MIDKLKGLNNNSLKNNKAFTLIELIVVIAVIGILVLLAAPKFLGYTKDAKLAQIKNDVRAIESAIEIERIKDEDFFDELIGGETVNKETLEGYRNDNSLFNERGVVKESNSLEDFYEISSPRKLVKTELKGQFYVAKDGEVLYYEKGVGGSIPSMPEYTVTFVDGNDDVISEMIVQRGESAEAPEAPEKHNGKYFVGWDKDHNDVQRDLIVKAQYEIRHYTISFQHEDGTVIDEQKIAEGRSATAPNAPEKHNGKYFVGWDKDYNDIQEDLIVKAQYETRYYTVTFQHEDGNVIDEQKIAEGESATAPKVPNKLNGLIFREWNNLIDNIIGDIIVVAIYTGPTDEDLDMVSDFEWVSWIDTGQVNSGSKSGYFKYVGTDQSVVEIPHVIQGVPVTSYYRMFYETGEDVQEVVSTNNKVTLMNDMFYRSQTTSLDLSMFDTSEVTNMYQMFANSQATSLDLSMFDTSKVTNMGRVFANSRATELDLSDWDTSNVTNMGGMFFGSRANTLDLSSFSTSKVTYMTGMFNFSLTASLDLSSFDTSNVTDMGSMFGTSQATEGYARTKADADKFNSSSNKPSVLVFTVK